MPLIPREQRPNAAHVMSMCYWLSCRLVDMPNDDARQIGRANLEALAHRYPKLAPRVRGKIMDQLYLEAQA